MASSITKLTCLTALALVLTPMCVRAEAPDSVSATEHGPYFYRGLGYGSDAAFSPASELLNGSLGVLQISSRWVSLDEIDWARGIKMTWESISHPGRTVDAYGRRDFITQELLPADYGWSRLQWVPNYTLHMIGGGARHRAFLEWYDAHDFPVPVLFAWGTTLLHAWGVEAVEHYNAPAPTVDPVADMLLFDPLGALLFSSGRVSRFFSRTLNMSIWSSQPAYNPAVNAFENIGQNYGLHYFFSGRHRVGLFGYMGMSQLLGITVRGGKQFDWSVGVGGAADELLLAERGNGMSAVYANVKPNAGVFLHRKGSLLASLQVSKTWAQAFRLNVYPGWISVAGLPMGFYAALRGNDPIFGITLARFPVGLALSGHR